MHTMKLLKHMLLLLSIFASTNNYACGGDDGCKVIVYGSTFIASCMVIGGVVGGTAFCPNHNDPNSCVGPAFIGVAIGFGASQVLAAAGAGVLGLVELCRNC